MEKTPIYSTFDLRRHAVEAVQNGLPQCKVAENYGIDRTTLYRWMQRFKRDGIDGLRRMPVSGRPRKLPDISDDLLKNIVLKSAVDFGFESDLWNTRRLHQVVLKKHRDDISEETIRRRLAEAGLTYQKPEREYDAADETIRKKWRRSTIPTIRRCVLKHHDPLFSGRSECVDDGVSW